MGSGKYHSNTGKKRPLPWPLSVYLIQNRATCGSPCIHMTTFLVFASYAASSVMKGLMVNMVPVLFVTKCKWSTFKYVVIVIVIVIIAPQGRGTPNRGTPTGENSGRQTPPTCTQARASAGRGTHTCSHVWLQQHTHIRSHTHTRAEKAASTNARPKHTEMKRAGAPVPHAPT